MEHLPFKRLAPLLLLTGVMALTPSAYAQEVEINDQARAHFQAGVNFMQDPDGARYEEAYREFSAAYAASPSWKILGNLGIAAMKLERDGEAIDAFEKYLAGGAGTLSAEERAQFQRDLDTLKAGVVTLSLSFSHPGVTVVDERLPVSGSPIRNIYSAREAQVQIGVRPGHHKLVAKLAGYDDSVWELDAVSGAGQQHAFELQKSVAAPPSSGASTPAGTSGMGGDRPVPTSVYVGLAATGALAVGAGVVGVLALGKNGEFDDANKGDDPQKAEDLHDSVGTLNLVTDVLLGATLVSAGIVTYLYVSRPHAESPQRGWIRVEPQVGMHSGSLQLTGAF